MEGSEGHTGLTVGPHLLFSHNNSTLICFPSYATKYNFIFKISDRGVEILK